MLVISQAAAQYIVAIPGQCTANGNVIAELGRGGRQADRQGNEKRVLLVLVVNLAKSCN